MLTPRNSPQLELREGSGVAIGAVSVGGAWVLDGDGEGMILVGLGVNVVVAGGVTSRTIFCPGRMTEVLFFPFQVIRSASGILYWSAIQKSVSPLWTV